MKFIVTVLALVFVKACIAHEGEAVNRFNALREKPYFRAAILEHAIRGNISTDTPSEIVAKNLDYYRRATEVARSKGADIIAFPEYGIFPFTDRQQIKSFLEEVPDPKKRQWNPCEQRDLFSDRPILYGLSCMARNNQIVVVADMGDIQPCDKQKTDKCPDDGTWHYNANVAFDRDGSLIGLYRKEHLFYEEGMDLPTEPQDPVFHTDFGTFAMYICFDIMFKRIADSGRDANIDGVILTTAWVETRPLLNAVPYWQAWTMGNGAAAYIAANAQVPGYKSLGSGVFSGKLGALKYTAHPDGLSKLLVSRAPTSRNQGFPFYNDDSSITVVTDDGTEPYELTEDEEGIDFPDLCGTAELGEPSDIYRDYRCGETNTTKYTLVELTEAEGNLEACNNGLCCTLSYSADSMRDTFYLAVFNGTREFYRRYSFCEEKCFVIRCDRFNGTECSSFPSNSNTVFRRLELNATFTTDFVYPSVVKTGLRLAPMDEWSHSLSANDTNYNGRLVYESRNSKPFLIAALYGRCYDRDPPYIR